MLVSSVSASVRVVVPALVPMVVAAVVDVVVVVAVVGSGGFLNDSRIEEIHEVRLADSLCL